MKLSIFFLIIIIIFNFTKLNSVENNEELKNVGVQGNLANNIKSMVLDPFKG